MVWPCGENDRIPKRVYVGECTGSNSMGILWKRWIDTMKDCLKKIDSDIRQERRMVHNRCGWGRFVRGNVWYVAQGMNP